MAIFLGPKVRISSDQELLPCVCQASNIYEIVETLFSKASCDKVLLQHRSIVGGIEDGTAIEQLLSNVTASLGFSFTLSALRTVGTFDPVF
ncbi:predicted protein [Uncinocarpus reesii 1704]|uniref:Uncharacterized protein n=1 Tax=Uncinocarpus reesii (strain UAMH 1704) TaxID=336963 RepID=C4JPX8_UNCRE|nr:uncharacterized protein UREG_04621 [Uncinocarpus reesii 1704]EEP79775.1 predicted protein [Uncinocarpus reesii 1704]